MLDPATVLARRAAEAAYPQAPALLPAQISGLRLDIACKTLISDIDLQLKSGQLSVIMGPNGAGKSLLLRLLHGLIAPSAGNICWGGCPLDAAIRKRQAMVFQHPVLLRRSVAGNLDFVLRLCGERNWRARREELLGFCGLSNQARQPARALSGGEQQRLALARALATDPDVLFLDEPTASLDPAAILRIETIIRATHEAGTKVVMVTHDLGQARRLADEVIFMHRGQILEQSPAGEFFTEAASGKARDYLAGRIVL